MNFKNLLKFGINASSFAVIMVYCSFLVCGAQQLESPDKTDSSISTESTRALPPQDLQAIEERKLQLEWEKFNFEKSRHSIWLDNMIPALSVAIPLLIGVITIFFQGHFARKLQEKSAKNALELQKESAKNTLELKAIEIILNSANTSAGLKRAIILNKLFPTTFPDSFVDQFRDKDTLPGVRYIDMKFELAKALAEADDIEKMKEIILNWRMIFHDENWIHHLYGKWVEDYPDVELIKQLKKEFKFKEQNTNGQSAPPENNDNIVPTTESS